ncbi:unnamed protein product [Caenorhabditis nigoni]
MVGCLLRGTHSVEQAKLYTMNINGTTCYSHRQESIDVIFDYLGISEIRQFFGCPRITMAGLMDIAKNFDSNITMKMEEEILQLMNYVAERTKNATSPMNLAQICRDFDAKFQPCLTLNCINKRLLTNRLKIPKMQNFDMDTKIQMMFALSVPLETGFLEEVKNHTEILELDDQQRILRHEKKSMENINFSNRWIDIANRFNVEENDEEFIDFLKSLFEKTKNLKAPMDLKALDPGKIQKIKEKIEEIDEFEISKKAEIAFALGVEISERFLRELRESAEIVEIDTKNRITKYASNDLKFEGIHEKSINLNLKKRFSGDKENVPAEKSARKSEISEELSLKEFLRSLLRPIRALNSPMITRVEFRIEGICFEEGNNDKKISIKRIHETLVSSLRLLTTPSSESENSESTCLFDFLCNLEIAIRFIRHPIMDSFQNKMKRLISEHANDQEEIPMINARSALEAIIDSVINV